KPSSSHVRLGKNPETEKPVVGFRVSSYKEGSLEVGPISHLRHLNDRMKFVVRGMEEYLEARRAQAFRPFSHEGIWRQLTVRTSNKDDVMLIVVIHPQELGESKLREIKEDVRRFFVEGGGKEAKVTSLFFKQYGQIQSGKEVEYEHIFGKTYIEENILGQTFRASPDAFLQVNTAACEVLYRKVSEVAEVDPASIVLDVCCGVGTIGLSLAQNAQKVLGVEMTAAAVENAKANAAANDVKNAVFYHGKAEDYINTLLARVQKTNTIAVVDPPRAGLSGSVMTAIRKAQNLDKLVYISCDPQAAITNFQALVRPRSKTYKGSFFVPIRYFRVSSFHYSKNVTKG
ncbi:UNVERIFIED_CONTAM: hypothetical protein GTU68_014149, partial [Idotea baltica]|nr:hypothetical protein [Idotea baltica]